MTITCAGGPILREDLMTTTTVDIAKMVAPSSSTVDWKMDWAEKQTRDMVRRAKAKWGPAWRLLSGDQRQGAVAQEVLHLMIIQDEELCSPLLLKLQKVAMDSMELVADE